MHTSGPRTSGPGISGPRASGPGISGPGISGPRTSGPKASGPGISGPRTSGPGISGPRTCASVDMFTFPIEYLVLLLLSKLALDSTCDSSDNIEGMTCVLFMCELT